MFAPEQKRALLIGFGLILAASAILLLIWLGMFLPGFAGEVFRKLAGMMWTPIIIDCSLFLLGIILVLSLNWFIRSRQGDEYVYLEQVNDPPEGLPDRAFEFRVWRLRLIAFSCNRYALRDVSCMTCRA